MINGFDPYTVFQGFNYRVTRQLESYILLQSICEFPWPAWAGASCSSGPQAGGTP